MEKEVRDLNQLPSKDGLAEIMSLLTMMTGKPFPDYNNLSVYVYVFEDNNLSNTNKSRTTFAIALNQTGNIQERYNFMSLVTGDNIDKQQ